MENPAKDPLTQLALADPILAQALSGGLEKRTTPLPPDLPGELVDFILKSISLEISFGEAVARSLSILVEDAGPEVLERFCRMVDAAAGIGPALARLMAVHSVPVLRANEPGLLKKFQDTVGVLHQKGIHTLYEPLACVSELIAAGDMAGADAFLDLLKDTFGTDLSYGQTRHFAHVLPTAAVSFPIDRRALQIRQIRRLMATDTLLAEAFLEGMSRDLTLLSPGALETFVTRGLQKAAEHPAAGRNFLSLSSGIARITLENLQTAVPLSRVRPRLERYLQARTGIRLAVRSVSDLPASARQSDRGPPLVCTDGQCLYFADIMDRCASRAENLALYLTLARLEAAHVEFGTFDFDLQRLREDCPELPRSRSSDDGRETDLTRFFTRFDHPDFADDLFTIFEHSRVFRLTAAAYPGLVRRVMPDLKKEMRTCFGPSPKDLRQLLYVGLMLGSGEAARLLQVPALPETVQTLCRRFTETTARPARPESAARLVVEAYPKIAHRTDPHIPFCAPFGRRVRPDLFLTAIRHLEPLIDRLQAELERQGEKAFRSDIRRQLMKTGGRLSPENLTAILGASCPAEITAADVPAGLYGRLAESLPDLFQPSEDLPGQPPRDGAPVFWYREWSATIGDYLDRHVRLVEHVPPGHAGDIFERVLKHHSGMVLTIRRAFELLKPQGLMLLRHWPDGDDVDLSALMAAVADRKAGHPPSDRIYLKRAKQARDVSVLLLVDLSASTRNLVPGTAASVLSVEKEAIVLFCEALRVVGDDFAVAGFSGHGRLQVDYSRFKDFDEPVTRKVRRRISGMAPQRSTRTGAALRHATRVLSGRPSRVRLLILLSDGYPNDTGYKRLDAVSDVQKAIAEASSKGIHVRPITVNLSAEKKPGALYGGFHHNVISDVRQLPDTLWRIYQALTR